MPRALFVTPRALVLLASLACVNSAALRAQEPLSVQTSAQHAADERIQAILRRPFVGKFNDAPLFEVLASIAQSTGLPIQLDKKILEEASVGADSPVSCTLSGISVRSALSLILKQVNLVWTIDNECLLVTTSDKASHLLVIKVYPVHNLVSVPSQLNPGGANYQNLIQAITDSIAPTTWDEVGGPGSISQFHGSGAIVVAQTVDVHDQLTMLLATLRTARDVQYFAPDPPSRRRHGSRHHRLREPAEPDEPLRHSQSGTGGMGGMSSGMGGMF